MKKLLVMCASRGRPDSLLRMIESVRSTSSEADVAVYIDRDDVRNQKPELAKVANVFVGDRVGQCTSLNSLNAKLPGYEAYGAATDDCVFETPGWDKWVLEAARSFRGGVGAIGPYCELQDRMDFPWLTGRWIEAAGGFVPYHCEHFYWDVALEFIGEATQIRFATKDEFHISHGALVPDILRDPDEYQARAVRNHLDAVATLGWLAVHRRPLIEKLNRAAGKDL